MTEPALLDFIKVVGVPVAILAVVLWGVWVLLHKVGKWAGDRADKSTAFIAPLVVRLVEATEANSRAAEATKAMLTTNNETLTWLCERITELVHTVQRQTDENSERIAVLESRIPQATGDPHRRFPDAS